MFYIHHSNCISPQHTFTHVDLEQLNESKENKLTVLEPGYETIPPGLLRRMGKAVRMGVGSGLPLLKLHPVQGIVIGTSNGGMEDCIKFLSQIIEYEEGRLTPTNFVQSTPNAIASQLGLMTVNKGYNVTHTHRGLAFENALLDVSMLLKEHPSHSYFVGGIDEISTYNHAIEKLGGWYKEETISNQDLYAHTSPGTLAGEGSAMFIVNNQKTGAICQLSGLKFIHSNDVKEVVTLFRTFVQESGIPFQEIGLFLSGENGDNRQTHYYEAIENEFDKNLSSVARFKHMTGDYPSVSAVSLWLACQIATTEHLPSHMLKSKGTLGYKTICLYNTFKGEQHGFLLISAKY
jgi:hypothetical protein